MRAVHRSQLTELVLLPTCIDCAQHRLPHPGAASLRPVRRALGAELRPGDRLLRRAPCLAAAQGWLRRLHGRAPRLRPCSARAAGPHPARARRSAPPHPAIPGPPPRCRDRAQLTGGEACRRAPALARGLRARALASGGRGGRRVAALLGQLNPRRPMPRGAPAGQVARVLAHSSLAFGATRALTTMPRMPRSGRERARGTAA